MVNIISFMISGILLVTYLFDPTELAIGINFVNLSDTALTFAEMLGNVVWVSGVLAFCLSVLLLIGHVYAIEETKVNMKVIISKLKKRPSKIIQRISQVCVIIIHIIGIGSGFAFTGICFLLLVGCIHTYHPMYYALVDDHFNNDLL